MRIIHKVQGCCLKYILMLLCLSVLHTGDCQALHNHSFRDINGKNIRLSDYADKKLLFIILPVSATDSLFVQLKNFAAKYSDKVQVIGVLSQEDGYSSDKKDMIKDIYQNTGILITDVMSSRKGSHQAPLMKWLTNKGENGHFDIGAEGPGQKFFVNEQGVLYAVLGGKLSLSSPFINKIVNASNHN